MENKDKQPRVTVGPLISSVEIPEGIATVGKIYKRTYFRPFYFSNSPNPDLSGELFRYTQVYTGEAYIHTVEASPFKGTPYPYFETKFDPNRPERLIDPRDVTIGGDRKLEDSKNDNNGDPDGIVSAEETNDTGFSGEEIIKNTPGDNGTTGSGDTGEDRFGKGSPGSDKYKPGTPEGSTDDANGSSYINEQRASTREGGTNPFFNRDGFILLPSWFQWITWPLAILADALFSGFGLTAGGKNLLLLIIIALIVYVLYKNGTFNRENKTKEQDRSFGRGENVRANDLRGVTLALS